MLNRELMQTQAASLLHELKFQIDDNWKNTNALIAHSDMHRPQPLLNHYSKIEDDVILKLTHLLNKVTILINQLSYIEQQVHLIASSNEKDNDLLIQHIKHQIMIGRFHLTIAEYFFKTYIYRLSKKYNPALVTAEKWIKQIIAFKKYLEENKLPYDASSLNMILINAYNHKAKIHRSLAGHNLNKLDMTQLHLAEDCYQYAIKMQNHPVLLNGLGFLYNDMSDQPDSEDKILLLDKSLACHQAALVYDTQDPNTQHGIGLTLYKREKHRFSESQTVKTDNLDLALLSLSFAQQRKPNARLCLDKAAVYLLLNDKKSALACLNQGLIIDPHHPLLLYQRGCFFLENKSYVSAKRDLQLGRAVSVDCSTLKILFDQALKNTSAKLSVDTNVVNSDPNLNELDIRKIAKQTGFNDALRECANYALQTRPDKSKPTVFISYAWPEPTHVNYQLQLMHAETVTQLSEQLEMAGFTIYLDIWHDVKGKNISDFIETLLRADFVLIIGTHHYIEKYQKSSQAQTADHVLQTELYFVSHLLRYSKETRNRIITVLLEGTIEESLPVTLHPKTPVDFVKNDRYKETLLLISAMHQFDVRDDRMVAIMAQFDALRKKIDLESPAQLASLYASSIDTLFTHREPERSKLISPRLQAKL